MVINNQMNIPSLTFERIKNDTKRLTIQSSDSYIQTYPEFIQYFRNIDSIEKHHLLISSHFVYGWMPTIITLDLTKIDEVVSLLNAAKDGIELSIDDLSILKPCINNSMVGLSKLLHFINPEMYAIWDSRIFRYVTGKKSQYGIDRPELYLQYLSALKSISSNKDYTALHEAIEKQMGYPITHFRGIEIVMFETDKQTN
ncbi:hypothetical protein [Carboxylicivirga sp. N1Y90]|uniref:hypothetical protein n=1 Tax=Carboxylicivirga fragile TaxID=3417571 RepID=UPI003D327595|nr:hypothetical protein [Marinilabiliaceae bacterium N1Y90]